MPKEDITGGLLLAVQKGESLEQAMLTFFNAGYKREDIEGAAADVQILPEFPQQSQQAQQRPRVSLKPSPQLKKLPQTSQVKPVKGLKPALAKKILPTSKPINEARSLSEPTPKLNEETIQPPKPHEQEQLIKEFQQPQVDSSQPIPQAPVESFQQPISYLPEPTEVQTQEHIQQQPQQFNFQPPQNRNALASNYSANKQNPKSVMIWILSALLVSLVLFLGGVFFFRDSLIGFFNNLL